MSKLDKDKVIADFTAAYEKANGKSPDIEAKGGWYSVDGGKNMRLAQLKEMGDSFGGAGASSAKKEKKAAPKKTAPKKTAAKKASNKGFSVKAFWSDQIKDENSGAILPR